MEDTDSYEQLLWQQYLTDIYFMYIFGDGIGIPTHTYQIHNSVFNIKNVVSHDYEFVAMACDFVTMLCDFMVISCYFVAMSCYFGQCHMSLW